MKFKMQRKIILSLVVIGILFGITCTAGCITGTDSHSPNDIVGKWYFESEGLTIDFKENNVAIWQYQGSQKSRSCEWEYLGSGIYYAWSHSGDLGTFYLDDNILYGGSYVVFTKENGPKNSIVGTWTLDTSFSRKEITTFTINDDLSLISDSSGIIHSKHGQLIGNGKNGEIHQISGEKYALGYVSSSNYLIVLFSDSTISAGKRI